jgi:hypothetical protein
VSRDKDEDKDKDEAAKVDAQRAELTEVTRQRNALKSQQVAAKVRKEDKTAYAYHHGKVWTKVIANSHQKTEARRSDGGGGDETLRNVQFRLTDANLVRLLGADEVRRRTRAESTRCTDTTTAVSLATSAQTVIAHRHLRGRMFERGISDEQLKRARKHGEKAALRGGNVAYAFDGVTYVTDSTGRRGITCYWA